MSKIEDDSATILAGVRGRRNAAWVALACGMLVATSAIAQLRTTGITGGLESGTDLVTLPATPRGSFLARECRECPSVRVSFDANTRYFIGKESVTYATLREAAGKGNIRLYVSYRLDDRTLTRLRLAAALLAILAASNLAHAYTNSYDTLESNNGWIHWWGGARETI